MKKKPTKKEIVLRKLKKLLDSFQSHVKDIFAYQLAELLDHLEKQVISEVNCLCMYAKMNETDKVLFGKRAVREVGIKLLMMDIQSGINSIRELTQLFLEFQLIDLEDEESNQMFFYRELIKTLSRLEEGLKELFGYFYMYAKLEEADKMAYFYVYFNETELRSVRTLIQLNIKSLRELTQNFLGFK